MSLGAVFKLVLRDERFDRFFTASDYLRKRLDEIRNDRKKRKDAGEQGYTNIQPTFIDIERTHILYVHGAYRPYVAIASEYTRVKPSGDGTAAIGLSGSTLQFTFPIFGHFTSDMVLHLRFKAIGNAQAAAAQAPPTAQVPLLRYCAYPGLRALKRVELKSDSVLIDDYTTDDAVSFGKFFVHADQRIGWDRCHGQQEERQAIYSGNGFMGTLLYRDGPQTPKLFQEEVDMFIPLQFWITRDASHAMLNDMISNTQRTITIEVAPLTQLIQALVPAPLPMPAIDNITPIGYTEVPLPFSKLPIEADLYVNGLYTNPEIHDIFASRIGFSLVRVHRRQTTQLQAPADRFLLDQLKFPAEFLMVGMRDRKLAADFDRWWLMGTRVPKTKSTQLMVPAMIWNKALQICQLVCREATEISTLESFTSTIGITAHGIEIYPQLPAAFYNAYMPIRYADNTMVVSPVDTSEFLVNFCLYPGKFNPSGYYNLSAGRELYIDYSTKSSLTDFTSGQYEMVISMSALNFLIRKGDKLSLKYAL